MGKFYDAIMGLVVGDALGVPYEFKERDTFKAVDMVGYGTHNQPVGTWSDDSSMTLATVESLARLGKIDLADIMNNFEKWLYRGEFTAHGDVFDVGRTTVIAVERYHYGLASVHNCGGKNMMDNGNGALMRILPLAFTKAELPAVSDVASLTHAHGISCAICLQYVNAARELLGGINKRSISDGFGIEHLTREQVKSTGYVVDTFNAALWCLMNTESYRECVLTAVNLGGDTDTIAAVAGGLTGIYYGVGGDKGIPIEWILKIHRRIWIEQLCEKFEARF